MRFARGWRPGLGIYDLDPLEPSSSRVELENKAEPKARIGQMLKIPPLMSQPDWNAFLEGLLCCAPETAKAAAAEESVCARTIAEAMLETFWRAGETERPSDAAG